MPISVYMRHLREKVGNDLLLLPSITIITFDNQGRILLVNYADVDKWGLPGGCVDPDELPADAAVRKMWEETGLLVEPTRVLGIYGGPEFHVTYTNRDEISYLMTVFECRVVDGEMRPDNIEISNWAYFSQANLTALELSRWVHIVLDDAFGKHNQARFRAPTWELPANGIHKAGMSNYVRRLREKIGNDLLIIPGASGVVFDERGQILLQKRLDSGIWHPPAGAIEPYESPANAVVREVWEETGLLVEPIRVTGVYGGPEFYETFTNGHQVAVFSTVFECRITGGQARPDGIESSDVRFFPLEELTECISPKRWRRRVADALVEGTLTHFDPPTWQPSALRAIEA